MTRPTYVTAPPAWPRRLAYAVFQLALLLAYLVGSLHAWRHGLHGAGRQTWRPTGGGGPQSQPA